VYHVVNFGTQGIPFMNISHAHDIDIGRDKWIIFGELNGLQNQAINIDALLQPLSDFWQLLETRCVRECCGIDAFDFWAENVLNNTKHLDHGELLAKLHAIKESVLGITSVAVVSQKLNNYFLKTTFIELLDHLILVYISAQKP
jgi:hypothetical protein